MAEICAAAFTRASWCDVAACPCLGNRVCLMGLRVGAGLDSLLPRPVALLHFPSRRRAPKPMVAIKVTPALVTCVTLAVVAERFSGRVLSIRIFYGLVFDWPAHQEQGPWTPNTQDTQVTFRFIL